MLTQADGVSRRHTTERRPHLDQCLADARAGQFDVLLTYDSSRLARDGRLWTNLVHGFGLAGVRVEYLTLPPDETPVGEFMRWIMAGVGQLERATIRERTHAGRLAKARTGRFVTGRWPYGYRYAGGQLTVDPGPAALMLTLFEWIGDEGLSLRGAVHRLIARGFQSPQGRAWRPTTLYRLLTNPAYKGLAVYNRRRHLPVEGRRSPRIAVKPRNEWVEITVPALVSAALWDRVQARLAQRQAGRPAKRVYLQAGLSTEWPSSLRRLWSASVWWPGPQWALLPVCFDRLGGRWTRWTLWAEGPARRGARGPGLGGAHDGFPRPSRASPTRRTPADQARCH